MTNSMFQPATRKTKKLRMAISGPSGSGKTYTALSIAMALGKPVAVIDTERGSASLYSDKFEFQVCELDDFNPENYIKALREAAATGFEVVVIDSLSHAWMGQGGVLDQVNKRGGNSFTDGWGKIGTPLQNRLMDAILSAPLHVICTMRVKTEYVVEVNANGKSVPKRVGLKEVQRDSVEYEFDLLGVLDQSSTMVIEKSRMSELAGAIIDKPDAKLARRIMAWLSVEPAVPSPATAQPPTGQPPLVVVAPRIVDADGWRQFVREHGFSRDDIEAALGTVSVMPWTKEHGKTLDDAAQKMIDWAAKPQTAAGR